MRFLRTNTAVIVTVGPFYDKTDGVTIETALTITNERITLTADTDDGAAPTNILDNVTGATSGTANDLNYITGNDAGMMQLELSAANTNRLGRMFLSITDAANHVPVFHEFMVLPAMIYDAFVAGTDVLDASVTQWLGTAAATPTTAGVPEVDLTHIAGAAVSTSTAQLGVNTVNAGGTAWNSGAIAAATIANGAIDAATFAADVDAEILSYIVDDATRIDASALNTASVTSVPAILVDTNELQTDWTNGGRLDLLLDATLADTNELQTDWANGGRLDNILDARSSQTSVDDLPTNAELATALAGADDAVLAQVALVKAKTDNLPASPAAVGSAMTLTSAAVDLLLDEVVEGTTTMREMLRGFASALLSKASGLGTASVVFRDIGDTKNRISATVDVDGNRSVVTLDLA